LYELVVIGAGPGGLSAAARCAELDVPHLLLESSPKIANTIHEVEDIKLSNHNKALKMEKKQKNKPADPDAFSFDDLPDISEENSNPFKKLANWAKQLF